MVFCLITLDLLKSVEHNTDRLQKMATSQSFLAKCTQAYSLQHSLLLHSLLWQS